MQPETPTSKPRRGRHFGRWILLGILAVFAWYGWKAYDYHLAKQEAKALGWLFSSDGPVEKIQRDWRAAFHIETWGDTRRGLYIPNASKFESHTALVRRLNPDTMMFWGSYPLKDLSSFLGLSRLSFLDLGIYAAVTNLDAIKGLKGLTTLRIVQAPSLNNIDGLKALEHLSRLHICGSRQLSNVDALRALKSLATLNLSRCTNLQNIDGLLGLTQLETLDLTGCTALPKDAVDAVKAALPNTKITTPDGKVIPPNGKVIDPVSEFTIPPVK